LWQNLNSRIFVWNFCIPFPEDLLIDQPSQKLSDKLPRKKPALNKFVIGGVLLVAAVIVLAITSLRGNTQYYLTVNELLANTRGQTQNVRISGVVLGSTILYDAASNTLSFEVANIPGDNATIEKMGGLASALHAAATDPTLKHLKVIYQGSKPDLLKDEAQAIMTGSLGSDGIFYASELLLKCPSRYEDSIPAQAGS
jgi:cytochrome c-type biogenesis protein CcmE